MGPGLPRGTGRERRNPDEIRQNDNVRQKKTENLEIGKFEIEKTNWDRKFWGTDKPPTLLCCGRINLLTPCRVPGRSRADSVNAEKILLRFKKKSRKNIQTPWRNPVLNFSIFKILIFLKFQNLHFRKIRDFQNFDFWKIFARFPIRKFSDLKIFLSSENIFVRPKIFDENRYIFL